MIRKKVEREVKIDNILVRKNKALLDIERNVAEKIALGEDIENVNSKVIKFDERLFKEKGLDSMYKGSNL